jgi:uncharacterized protein YjiS (DUF1127 family)
VVAREPDQIIGSWCGKKFRPERVMARSGFGIIRRIVAAIGLWCARARSRRELRELSEHLLKDIGLRREDLGYEFPKLFWRCG